MNFSHREEWQNIGEIVRMEIRKYQPSDCKTLTERAVLSYSTYC